MSLPPDPFGRSALPATFSREHRVRLLGEAAQALLNGELPDAPARLFLAGGLVSWLQEGGTLGALERDFWKVSAPHRSTMTPARLWQRSSRRATSDEALENMSTMSNMLDNLESSQ